MPWHPASVSDEDVCKIASLLREPNIIDEKLATLIERPLTSEDFGDSVDRNPDRSMWTVTS